MSWTYGVFLITDAGGFYCSVSTIATEPTALQKNLKATTFRTMLLTARATEVFAQIDTVGPDLFSSEVLTIYLDPNRIVYFTVVSLPTP